MSSVKQPSVRFTVRVWRRPKVVRMDKKSLFWWYRHSPVEADLETRFHGGEHAEILREGQDWKLFQTTTIVED